MTSSTRRYRIGLLVGLFFFLIGLAWLGAPVPEAPDLEIYQILCGAQKTKEERAARHRLFSSIQAGTIDAKRFRALLSCIDHLVADQDYSVRAKGESARIEVFQQFHYHREIINEVDRAVSMLATGSPASWPYEVYSLVWEKALSQSSIGDNPGLASSISLLRKVGMAENDLEELGNTGILENKLQIIGMAMPWLWYLLITLPAIVVEIRRRSWLKQHPMGSTRDAAFFSWRISPIPFLWCTGVVIVVSVLELSGPFPLPADLLLLMLLNGGIAFGLTCWPLWLLDREVRKSSWSLFEYISFSFRMIIVQSWFPLIFLIAYRISNWLISAMPFWVIARPLSAGMLFLGIGSVFLLLSPAALPLVLGLRKRNLPPATRVPGPAISLYLWELKGSGISNALAFGYGSPFHSVAVTGPFLETMPPDEAGAILAHEEGHLVCGHLQMFFLLQVLFLTLAAAFIILRPVQFQLILADELIWRQTMIVLGGYLAFTVTLQFLARKAEYEADAYAGSMVGPELVARALERLTMANQMPTDWKPEEGARLVHPSLNQRRKALYAAIGSPFPEKEPAISIPTAFWPTLWESRLAVSQHDREQGIAIVASEYRRILDEAAGNSTTASTTAQATISHSQIRKLVDIHSALGGSGIILHQDAGLVVTECAQKRALRKRFEAMQQDEVCRICHTASRRQCDGDWQWEPTSDGCRFIRQS